MLELRGIGVLLVLAAALFLPAVASAAPPPNDDFAAAEELIGRSIVVSGINKDATKETGELDHAGKPGGVSVWYRWTAPASGQATLSTCGSGFDTLLAVYTGGSVDALAPVAASDDACGLQSSVSFDASDGVTYRIAVDGLQGATGAFTLDLRLPPPNDDFADAVQLAGDDGTISGTTEGSSAEDGEPYDVGNSVWYSWTAASTGPATVETCGSSLDTILSVYTGADVNDLTYVRSSDDACGVASRASFDATAGVRYSIAVESYGGGEFLLTWNRNPGPPEAITSPTITGTAREGEILAGSNGEWTGAPTSFAYEWGRCDANYDTCDTISGATSQSYTLTAADVGHYVYFVVTATNVTGSGQAYAETNSTVRPRGPANTYPPQIAGVARIGERLRASQGIWRGLMPIQFKYQWQACDAAGNACQDLPGEIFDALDVTRGHVGRRIRIVVTGVNPDGATSAASAPTDVVAAPPPPPTTKPPVRRCVVPNVRGRSLRQAKAAIRRARCATGRVRKAFSRSVRRGRVISQRPGAGKRLPRGSKVNLVISKGRKR